MPEKHIAERKPEHPISGEFLREIIFGANDGVVTAIGFLMGISGTVSQQKIIVLSGVLTIIAGSVSMTLGNYLGVKSQNEYFENKDSASWIELNPILAGIIMGVSYLLAGFPPLLPFIVVKPTARALVMSIIVAIFVMGAIGFVRWTLNKNNLRGKIVETVVIGIIAAGIGFLVGEVLNFLGISGVSV